MFPASSSGSGLGERIFSTAEVSGLAGITLRQLQWWDERRLVCPRKQGHRRTYTLRQVLKIVTAGELRHKGLSLQKVRRVVRLLDRRLAPLGREPQSRAKWFLLTDGQMVRLEPQVESAIRFLAAASKPMYLVSLGEHLERLASPAAPHRYVARQLPLF